MTRRGFTMVELTMVILILGIAAAAVALKIQRPMRSAQLADVVGAFVDYDRTTRAAAVQQDRPLRLVADLAGGCLWRADEAGARLDSPALRLPAGVRIERLLVRHQDSRDGAASLSCSRAGLMPTYAVLLEASGARQWFVVAGLTGQLVQVSGDDEVRDILAALGGGHNAG